MLLFAAHLVLFLTKHVSCSQKEEARHTIRIIKRTKQNAETLRVSLVVLGPVWPWEWDMSILDLDEVGKTKPVAQRHHMVSGSLALLICCFQVAEGSRAAAPRGDKVL